MEEYFLTNILTVLSMVKLFVFTDILIAFCTFFASVINTSSLH